MSTARKVLLVDDDDDLRTSLKDQLVLHDEFEVSEAGTASKGIEAARRAASILLSSMSVSQTWTVARP